MDVLTSAEFRKRYAKLTRTTRVTVNGHLIGEWTPMGLSAEIVGGQLEAVRDPERLRERTTYDSGEEYGRFGTPRPAPKPSSR